MCLITEQKVPLEAQEDMVVYKAVIIDKTKITSVYYDFEWTLGKIESALCFTRDFNNGIFADQKCIDAYEEIDNVNLVSISEGLHSATTRKRAIQVVKFYQKNCTLAQCTIPKGALYYKDVTGLIVSNQLRLDRLLT